MKYTHITPIIVVLSVVVVAAAAWHSVEEIHYLKSFFPDEFTVEEAYYAAKIEVIKVTFISFPLMYLTVLVHFFIKGRQ